MSSNRPQLRVPSGSLLARFTLRCFLSCRFLASGCLSFVLLTLGRQSLRLCPGGFLTCRLSARCFLAGGSLPLIFLTFGGQAFGLGPGGFLTSSLTSRCFLASGSLPFVFLTLGGEALSFGPGGFLVGGGLSFVL